MVEPKVDEQASHVILFPKVQDWGRRLLNIAVLIIAVSAVAFTNGANANFKGVASLYASGTASLKTALIWGNLFTFAGSLASFWLSSGLLKSFGGKGILPDAVVQGSAFSSSVALAAAGTSFLATRLSFPVSTTHALIGAIGGCGAAAFILESNSATVRWNTLASSFLYPLLISPLLAIVLAWLFYRLLALWRISLSKRTKALDAVHFASAGAASFSRGLNDTPKMVAILLLIPEASVVFSFVFVSLLILFGGIFDGRNVAETLGKKIAELEPGEGLVASSITSLLVSTASYHSLPVSTTHVSVGALVGIGWSNGKARWRMIGEIFLAWITTVPCGLVLGMIIYLFYSLSGLAK